MAMSGLVAQEITYAPRAFQLLNGCLCLYKPSKKSLKKTRQALTLNISNELNSLECRPPKERIEIEGDLTANSESNLKVVLKTNLADHPLVCGSRYGPKHIALSFMNNPGWYASGLVIGFIGNQTFKNRTFNNYHLPKIYEVKGKLGLASRNCREDGKIYAKSTYKHVKQIYYERILSKIESNQKTLIFRAAGVDMQSEKAYQMAIKGTIKPNTQETQPLIYGIQPISFEPPDFSFNVQCQNENEVFLAELVNDIGVSLKTTALCTGIRLIKYGPFTVKNALLQKHWTLENLIENIHHCNKIIEKLENQENEK